jgi:hypothetical protein
MDGVNNCAKIPNNTVKLSEQLRRERIKLFGKSDARKQNQTNEKDAYKQAFEMPQCIKNTPDVWPYIAMVHGYIERQTGVPLNVLFSKRRSTGSNHAKAFIVILRYGFNINRRLICEYLNINITHVNWLLDNYRENAIYSPEFNDVLAEVLEYINGL